MRIAYRAQAAGVALITSLLLIGCGDVSTEQPQTNPSLKVAAFTTEAAPLTLSTDLPGRTIAYRTAEVRPQVNGIVQERLFVEGSEVEAGQQLYQIDPRTYEAELARAEANLATANNLANRYERLLKTKAVSHQQYDDARAVAQQAEAEVDVAKINVQYTKVLAPISGRIGRSAVTEGALVTAGQPQELATVTQLDPIYVDVTQPINRMTELRRALESGLLQSAGADRAVVRLKLDDGSVYPLPGQLKFTEVTVDQSTGSVTLRAEFPNPERSLLPGMFVHAQLQEGIRENAILVPQKAVLRDSQGVAQVWVIAADNTVALRDVTTLRTVGNMWLIGEGLADGERVVLDNLHRLRRGLEVDPVDTEVQAVTDFSDPSRLAAH